MEQQKKKKAKEKEKDPKQDEIKGFVFPEVHYDV